MQYLGQKTVATDIIDKAYIDGITGTSSSYFQVDNANNGPRIKNNAGVLEIRNAADNAYASLKALSLVVPEYIYTDNGTMSLGSTGMPNNASLTFDFSSTANMVRLDAHNDAEIRVVSTSYFNYVFTHFSSTWADRTAEAKISHGTAFTIINTSTSDWCYVGNNTQYSKMYFDLSATASTITAIQWQYSTGSGTWATLTVTDGTAKFTTDGSVTFTAPGDWAQDTVNGATGYWVRFNGTSNPSTKPTAKVIVPSSNALFSVYSNHGDTNPAFAVTSAGNVNIGAIQTNSNHALYVSGTGYISSAFSSGSTIYSQRGSLATTSTDGIMAINTSSSTSETRVQMSPRFRLSGTVWDTTASATRTTNWKMEVLPISSATPTANLIFGYDYNAGGYTNRAVLTSTGRFAVQELTIGPLPGGSGSGSQIFSVPYLNSSEPRWVYLGRINAIDGADTVDEIGYVDIELFDGRSVGNRNATSTRLFCSTRSGAITCYHTNIGSLNESHEERSYFAVYNDGSNNFHLFIRQSRYSYMNIRVNSHNCSNSAKNPFFTPVIQDPTGGWTSVYATNTKSNLTQYIGIVYANTIWAESGAECLRLKPGAADHSYLGFYARTAANATRSGYIGYGSAATTLLSITNEITNGSISIIPNGAGTVNISSAVLTSPNITNPIVGRRWTWSNAQEMYRWYFGGDVDLAWKKIADVTIGTGTYRAVSFEIDIIDAGTNYGASTDAKPMRYYVAMRRSGATQDNLNDALVSGPVGDYVRAVKISTGVYELQVKQAANHKHMEVTARVISQQGSTVTYIDNPANGDTNGTIYTATAVHAHNFTRVVLGCPSAFLSTTYPLQIYGGSATNTVLSFQTDATNNSNQDARIYSRHYTSAEEPLMMVYASSNSTENFVAIGGGSSVTNAATNIRFYTAANTITTTGTQRMTIDTNGHVGIGTTPSVRFHVLNDTTLGGTFGDVVNISRIAGKTSNFFMKNEWILRDANGTDWLTARWHDAISIDTSYLVPGTSTRCYWERDPQHDIQCWGTSASVYMTLTGGKLGLGTTPTAIVHLKAGTSTANTAPLKFTSGTHLTTPEAGSMEYNGSKLFFTYSTARHQVLTTGDSDTSPVFSGVTVSTGGLIVKSPTTTQKFTIQYNDTEGSLDFVYSTS